MDKLEFAGIRRLLGKTQNQMSRILSISPKAVQSFEQGWRDIPSHIAREMLLLGYLKQNPARNIKPCWEVKNCTEEVKKDCLIWDLQIKQFCWNFNGLSCQGETHGDWESKIQVCRDCEVFKSADLKSRKSSSELET